MKIFSSFKQYNINPEDKNTSDCVKRSLAFAYGLDYKEVSSELNKIKRDIGSSAFNSRRTFLEFLKIHGSTSVTGVKEQNLSEQEFSEVYSSGTYICLSGRENVDYSTHMVCIHDGDIYDSWDSRNYIVREAWRIQHTSFDLFDDLDFESIFDALSAAINRRIETIQHRHGDSLQFYVYEDLKLIDKVTARVVLRCKAENDAPRGLVIYPGVIFQKQFRLKLNIRKTIEENLATIQKNIIQAIDNWTYKYWKDVEQTRRVRELNMHPYCTGMPRDLLNLPEWARPFCIDYYTTSDGSVYVSFLKGDRATLSNRPIDVKAYGIRDLKVQVEKLKPKLLGGSS